jgi:hypothetical protein
MVGVIEEYVHGNAAILSGELGASSMPFSKVRTDLQLFSYSVLPAITVDGIIYSHIKIGGYNGDQFIEYLEGLLSQMNPYPAPRSVLVLDNCSIHHVEGVEELCTARCVWPVYR